MANALLIAFDVLVFVGFIVSLVLLPGAIRAARKARQQAAHNPWRETVRRLPRSERIRITWATTRPRQLDDARHAALAVQRAERLLRAREAPEQRGRLRRFRRSLLLTALIMAAVGGELISNWLTTGILTMLVIGCVCLAYLPYLGIVLAAFPLLHRYETQALRRSIEFNRPVADGVHDGP